jgi:hypothetical protein
MRNLPVLVIECEMLFMNFFEWKLVKSRYLKIIRLIHMTLAIQQLAACCSESLSPSYRYLPIFFPPPFCTHLFTRPMPVVSQPVQSCHKLWNKHAFLLFCKYVDEFSGHKFLSIWVSKAAIQSLHSPVNSVDAERYFSIYNIVVTDWRQRLKEENIEITPC